MIKPEVPIHIVVVWPPHIMVEVGIFTKTSYKPASLNVIRSPAMDFLESVEIWGPGNIVCVCTAPLLSLSSSAVVENIHRESLVEVKVPTNHIEVGLERVAYLQ
jgi:hypothetical protein